jgi:Spy/CpxP family protein refolding chaperone
MKLTKSHILSVLVVLLVCINLTTLATIWLNKPFDAMKAQQAGPKQMIIERLHFNEQQQQAFSFLVDEHREQMKALRRSILESKEAFYANLGNEEADSAETYAHIADISRFEQQAGKITFEHFRKVRSICDPRQKREFDKVIGGLLRSMTPGSHHEQFGSPPGGPHNR